MFATIYDDLTIHSTSTAAGLLVGSLVTGLIARWKRYRERQRILQGDARDTVVIQQHLLEASAGDEGAARPAVLRIRSLGQAELRHVVPNGHLAAELRSRADEVNARDTLIAMDDAEGSYLLETLTNFVCDRVANQSFAHDLHVMAPCCEPAGLAEHQPIIILLVAVRDLAVFESWPACRNLLVEHGSDGARILTLMELAKRHREEQAKIACLRRAGQRTRYAETMYVLDLALDRRTAAIPVRPVAWGRFEDVLRQLNLE